MLEPSARPLLTIAIPTFNRSANLTLLLGAIRSQVAALPQVELLVSDNASPDDTETVMQRFLQEGLRCRYIRNATNIGADPNFLQCYEQATGRYVWIFGDDDYIFPGSLDYLLRLLAVGSYDLVYLAPFGFIQEPNERGLANSRPRAFSFTDPQAFVHAVGLRGDFALLSAIIFNKDNVEQHVHSDFAQDHNTNLLQLGWIFTALNHLCRGLIIDRGLYAVCEFNPQRRFDVIRVFGVNWARAAGRYLGSGTELHSAVLRDQLYSWFTTNWYGMRRRPDHTIINDPVGQMRPIYGRIALFWVCTWPLLAWPMPLAGAWLALWRGFRRLDRAIHRALHPALKFP